jgi:hypothetical protein
MALSLHWVNGYTEPIFANIVASSTSSLILAAFVVDTQTLITFYPPTLPTSIFPFCIVHFGCKHSYFKMDCNIQLDQALVDCLLQLGDYPIVDRIQVYFSIYQMTL